jgi:hypothetical protein
VTVWAGLNLVMTWYHVQTLTSVMSQRHPCVAMTASIALGPIIATAQRVTALIEMDTRAMMTMNVQLDNTVWRLQLCARIHQEALSVCARKDTRSPQMAPPVETSMNVKVTPMGVLLDASTLTETMYVSVRVERCKLEPTVKVRPPAGGIWYLSQERTTRLVILHVELKIECNNRLHFMEG